jgi:predicted DNA-binding protein YlxM (UPF0122 family)
MKEFDRRHGKGAQQKLLDLFRESQLSASQIGQQFGVTKQAVHQWYQQMVANGLLAPNRHQMLRQARMQEKLDQARPEIAKSLQTAVSRFGLTVEPILAQRSRVYQNKFLIGPHVCWVASATLINNGERHYWHWHRRPTFLAEHPDVAFVILLAGTDWYCIPAAEVKQQIYLPVNPAAPRLKSPWLDYREAFSLMF